MRIIRAADVDDIPGLCDMAEEFHKESPVYAGIAFVREDMKDVLKRMITEPRLHCVFIACRDGKMLGMIGGNLGPMMFNLAELYSVDIGFYVKPEERKTGTIQMLIEAYEDWAARNGVPHDRIKLSQSSGINAAAVDALLKGMGYTDAGTIYRKSSRR